MLLIIADDLRGGDFEPPVGRPNLARLATRAMEFTHAYAQGAGCNASRTSLLTGLRPTTTGITNNRTFYRRTLPDAVSLPQLLLANGYFTASIGKVFHKGQIWRETDTWLHESFPSGRAIGRRGKGRRVTKGRFSDDRWLAAKGKDSDQPDGAAALQVVEMLEEVRDVPFFIAVGFHRPHAPFRAPRRYFRPYKLPGFPFVWDALPDDTVPAAATPNSETAEILESLSLRGRRELMRGYYASVSFMDAQVGVVLDSLDRLSLWDRTIVLFLSDHGYHLGEHGWWGKNTLFEESLRVPFLLHVPTLDVAGDSTDRVVELLDVYPTLAELLSLDAPAGLEGCSLRRLLEDPQRPGPAAFSTADRGSVIGRSVRDERWRYTRWGGTEEVELYDHLSDPEESVNLAGDPAYALEEARLRALLDDS